MKTRLAIVVGTRPEAIKLWPVWKRMKSEPSLDVTLISSGQHGEMLDAIFDSVRMSPDEVLPPAFGSRSLADLNVSLLRQCTNILSPKKFDGVLVHGDTSTAFCAAYSAFLSGLPVFHVEAGLRTGNLQAPYPEEANRQLIARISSINFAPTELARQNLLREGIDDSKIEVTGNTIVDSVRDLVLDGNLDGVESDVKEGSLEEVISAGDFALITLHRRENAGDSFEAALSAVASLAADKPEFSWVFPVHPNPIIRNLAASQLGHLGNVLCTEPLDYMVFLRALSRCRFAFTDSGGIQEEGVTLGKRVFVLRNSTERPEGVETGLVTLVDSSVTAIVSHLGQAMNNSDSSSRLNLEANPFGQGRASEEIKSMVTRFFSSSHREG